MLKDSISRKTKQVWAGQGYSHTVNWKVPGHYECTDVAQQPSSKAGEATAQILPKRA